MRRFLNLGYSLIFVLILTSQVYSQDELNVIRGEASNNNWLHFSDASNSLYHHLAGQAYKLLIDRADKVAELQSLSDWQKRQESVRETLMDIMGPFPEKTPLNARTLRIIQKDYFRVEHIVFESQPGFYVTSSLFIPNQLEEQKGPAVIYVSGHTADGYRAETYQHKILNLVKKGFIVFAIDPVGQGERIEYYNSETGRSHLGGPTREHSYPGAQAFITGSSQIRYMTWDGIRAIDYLLTRDEVDESRIGITGRSGGGTQSAFIAAMDERIHASAPEAYITNFTRLLQTRGPQDAEQNLYHGILRGIDHADLLTVRAPKPVLMITTTEDFFSIQGAIETAGEVKRIYQAYGMEENFQKVEDGGGHESTKKNREAMYAFFQEHLDNPGKPDDEAVGILDEDEIRVTATGQLSTSIGGETVFSLNRLEAKQRIDKLRKIRNSDDYPEFIIDHAKELSGYIEPGKTTEPVFTGRIQRDGYQIEKYFIKGEGDYVIPYLMFIPDTENNEAMLYLHPSGKAAEASAGEEIEMLVKSGYTVLAPDLIGIGEMGPGDFRGDAYIDGISYNMWFASILIGRSIIGVQAGDVIRLTRMLKDKTDFDNIYGLARGHMSPILLHAAAFEPSISRIALLQPYSSYRSIVMNREYRPGYIHSTVAGTLLAYDLPDLAATLAPRKLFVGGVMDGAGNTLDTHGYKEDLAVIKTSYEKKNALEQLLITTDSSENLNRLLLEWLEEK